MKAIYQKPAKAPVPRLALRPDEAAEALGMSRSTLDKNTAPKGLGIPSFRIGARVLYSVNEIQEWMRQQQADQHRGDVAGDGGPEDARPP